MDKENVEFAKLLLTPFVYIVAIGLTILLIGLYRKWLRELFEYLGIKNLKFAGIEISMSSAEITIAQKDRSPKGMDEKETSELAKLAELSAPYLAGRRLLWVDDVPSGNIRERRAFRLLGIEVVNCLNTPEAIEALCRDDYDLVISDIGREPASFSAEYVNSPCDTSVAIMKARIAGDNGWKTLAEINSFKRKIPIPVIFYHGRPNDNEERDSKAREEGGIGATASPAILYRWVLSVLLMTAILNDDKLRHLITVIPGDIRRRLAPLN